MPLTVQSQAIGLLNQVNTLAQAAIALQDNIIVLQQATANFNGGAGAAATWAQMATCSLNADGSLGSADTIPVSTHPLNAAVLSGLTRAATPTQYNQAVTALGNVQTAINAVEQALQVFVGT
jgi:hypothetical protein